MTNALALLLDPSLILVEQGIEPDAWQRDLLLSQEPQLLLNCSRQSGKSTTVAALALHQIVTAPGSLVLLVAPSERQSHELFRKVLAAYHALGQPVPAVKFNQSEMELAHGSRLVALPGREDTIRSFSAVNLLILDEAARVPDDLYRSVRPMLAVSRAKGTGRLVALSTPFGQRGWFYDEWTGPGPFKRIHIPWTQCPRITQEFIEEETRALGPTWVDQEYNARFTTMQGLVYPDFPQCLINDPPSPEASAASLGGRLGGLDFGWRNPFAAIWGYLDDSGTLIITHERYLKETPIADHAAALPKDIIWYADPAGATEIAELRRAGHVIKKGNNDLRNGISLVTQRIRLGKLKVVAPNCPNLVLESRLYRYPTEAERQIAGENPIDAHNHALAALRYLISRLPSIR